MSKFWQKKYISKYTGEEIDAAVAKAGDLSKVTANPTLAGTEDALTGLQIGDTKYKAGGGDSYLVNLSDDPDDPGEYIIDKTFTEIQNAALSGKFVYMINNDATGVDSSIFYLVGVDESQIVFHSFFAIVSNTLEFEEIKIGSGGYVFVQTAEITVSV